MSEANKFSLLPDASKPIFQSPWNGWEPWEEMFTWRNQCAGFRSTDEQCNRETALSARLTTPGCLVDRKNETQNRGRNHMLKFICRGRHKGIAGRIFVAQSSEIFPQKLFSPSSRGEGEGRESRKSEAKIDFRKFHLDSSGRREKREMKYDADIVPMPSQT